MQLGESLWWFAEGSWCFVVCRERGDPVLETVWQDGDAGGVGLCRGCGKDPFEVGTAMGKEECGAVAV